MNIKNQYVTAENFWEMHSRFENDTLAALRSKYKLKNAYYLARHLLIRLFTCLIVIPSSIAFMLFILSSYDFGTVEMVNFILNDTDIAPMSAHDASILTQTWLFLGGLILMMSLALWPWKSPARRETAIQMHIWWYEHGDKLPGLKQPAEHRASEQ